jgi:quercetin dioxygenase-like cupin family protein
MLKKSLVLAAIVGFAISGAVYAQQQATPVQPSPVKRTLIGKMEVPGTNTDVVSAVVEIAPGFKAGRHFHPGTVQAQILEGEFWLAIDGQPEKIYKAGESLELKDKVIHNEGNAGDKPMKLVAVYMIERGQPLVQPVK